MKRILGIALGAVSLVTLSSCGDDYEEYNFIKYNASPSGMAEWNWFNTTEGWEENFILPLPNSVQVDDVKLAKKWDFFTNVEDFGDETYDGYNFDSNYYIKDSTISDPTVKTLTQAQHFCSKCGHLTRLIPKTLRFGVTTSYQSGDDAYYINDKEFYDSFGFYQYEYSIAEALYLDAIGTEDDYVDIYYVGVYNEYTFEVWEKSIFKDNLVGVETMLEPIGAYGYVVVKDYSTDLLPDNS